MEPEMFIGQQKLIQARIDLRPHLDKGVNIPRTHLKEYRGRTCENTEDNTASKHLHIVACISVR